MLKAIHNNINHFRCCRFTFRFHPTIPLSRKFRNSSKSLVKPGNVAITSFWGTWCAPCRMEIPDLINLHEKYNGDGLEVVGVTISSGSMENISDFVERWKINYLVLTDIDNDETLMLTDEYSRVTGRPITGVPSTFIIDRDGYIVKSYIGPRSERVFYNDLKPYL